MKQMSGMADETVSLKLQLAHLTSSRLPSRRGSRSNLRLLIFVVIITNFRAKARRCSSTCCFKSKGKPISQRIDATVFSDSSNSGRIFYVCNSVTRKRFLVDTGAQISVLPPTPAGRRLTSSGLHPQAANCSPISTFGSLPLILNVHLRRSFSWVFVIADVPYAILDPDFLTKFDLLVEC
ncbi:hypothetical protein SprV_0301204700 [Sparganum proliferum]